MADTWFKIPTRVNFPVQGTDIEVPWTGEGIPTTSGGYNSILIAKDVPHGLYFDSEVHTNGLQALYIRLNESRLDVTEVMFSAFSGSHMPAGYGSSWRFKVYLTTSGTFLVVDGTPPQLTTGYYLLSVIVGEGAYNYKLSIGPSTQAVRVRGFYVKENTSISTTEGSQSFYISSGAIYVNSKYAVASEGLFSSGGSPLAKFTNGLWYAFGDNSYYTVQSSFDGTISVSYPSSFNMPVSYLRFDGERTTTVSLGTKQAGSEYTAPTADSAGTRTHYNFVNWQYDGVDLNPGDKFHSHPANPSLDSVWVGKEYSVSFTINRADAQYNGQPVSTLPARSTLYPGSVILPTLTSPTATFNGWIISGTTKKGYYSPTGNTTAVSSFTDNTYTVRLLDLDGTQEKEESYTVGQANPITFPSEPSGRGKFEFLGWAVQGSRTISYTKDTTSFRPTGPVTLIRIYKYKLTLARSNTSGDTLRIYDSYFTGSLNIQLPDSHSESSLSRRGFNFVGWSQTYHVPDINYNRSGESTVHRGTITITLATPYTVLYAEYASVELTQLSLSTDIFSIKIGQEKTYTVPDSALSPTDWLGRIYWEVQSGSDVWTLSDSEPNNVLETHEFRLEASRRSLTIRALNDTFALQNPYLIRMKGKAQEWDTSPQAVYIYSERQIINVSNNINIQFLIKKDVPCDQYIERGGTVFHEGNVWAVSDGEWVLTRTLPPGTQPPYPEGTLFPKDPTLEGYVFTGWVDNDGNKVAQQSPYVPNHPTICYATWTKKYVPMDRDVLILQKFNREGDSLEVQVDMGAVISMSEMCSPSVTTSPTPTMSSRNTFILDTGVGEEVPIEIRRKHPDHPDDSSSDPSEWSNGKWLTEVRSLVDRWQSETDGIKVLYIPRGLRIKTLLGDTFAYGSNYPMLGYVHDNTGANKDNLGLLFGDQEQYKLVGFNGVFSKFSDKLTSESNMIVAISMSITLGGMTSNYERYRSVLGGN